MMLSRNGAAKPVELGVVAVKDIHPFSGGRSEPVIRIGTRRREIQRKDTVFTSENQDFLLLILHKKLRMVIKSLFRTQQMDHRLVEIPEESVAEIVRIREGPLPARVLVRPAVPLAGEVDPFRMAEFVAHEIEVAVARGGGRHQADHLVEGDAAVHGHQADHLVEGDAAVHDRILGFGVHGEVHFLVHQPENQGLVSHQRLVVALGVGDGLLVGALVGELPPDLAHGPLLVGELLDPLDPVVRDAHRHPEVEAHAAGRQRGGQAGHAGDVLGDGEGVRVHLLHEDVREGEVRHRVLVHALVEVVVIAHEILPETVVPV